MQGNNLHQRLLYPARLSFKVEGEINSFLGKKKLKEFVTIKPELQKYYKTCLKKEEEKQNKGT